MWAPWWARPGRPGRRIGVGRGVEAWADPRNIRKLADGEHRRRKAGGSEAHVKERVEEVPRLAHAELARVVDIKGVEGLLEQREEVGARELL